MKRNLLFSLLSLIALVALSMNISATANTSAIAGDQDTETRIIDAKVVEVTDARISVIAQSGVEHVIAINRSNTRVRIEGPNVSLKDVREGDVVTIELDAASPMKMAKNILIAAGNSQVARANRK